MYTGRELLIYLALIHMGDYNLIMNDIKRGYRPDYDDVIKVNQTLTSKVITYLDEGFPIYLRRMPHPVIVLFYYGDISLISPENLNINLAVIGTREPTTYGMEATQKIVSKISRKVNIVSGLAKGIDSIAHQTAVSTGGKTIAVLGSGIDNVYPYENRLLYRDIINSGGLVISEYPGQATPDGIHFPFRNRIIAAVSRGVLVTEAYERSGTSITVGYAIETGRTVMCVPYPYTVEQSLCNQLINEGASLVRNGDDVLFEMDLVNA